MGASCVIRYYDGHLTKTELENLITADMNQDELENGSSYSGSWANKSRFVYENINLHSLDSAEEWIASNNFKWGPLSILHVTSNIGTPSQNKEIENQKKYIFQLNIQKINSTDNSSLLIKEEQDKLKHMISNKTGPLEKHWVVGGLCSS